MAAAIGYADAAQKPMESMAPQLWQRVQDAGLGGLLADLGDAIRRLFSARQEWASASEFLPIGVVGLNFLRKFGIQYRIGGGKIVAELAPQVQPTLH